MVRKLKKINKKRREIGFFDISAPFRACVPVNVDPL
jgi:hypothetical protein